MIKLSRKAQSMPLNVVIVAALVLIVLIVLIIIFTGKFGVFAAGTTSCEETHRGTCSGSCPYNADAGRDVCECDDNEIMIRGTNCEKDESGTVCCVPLIKEKQPSTGE